ncbi:MAG: hypothetical protein NXI21_04090 [Alphaproteobacteria bacterium]|nr:hypothetical protein [Alphaproteobacteria bacterium]
MIDPSPTPLPFETPGPPARIAPDVGPGLPDLPYAAIACPPYRPGTLGGEAVGGDEDPWRFMSFLLPMCPGYFGGPRALSYPCYALSRGAVTWMSLTPMEVESLLPGIDAAAGRVVVGGMGLALAGYAVAMKETVERVTIVELDPQVAALAEAFAGIADWPCRDKVEIVVRDLADHRDPSADFLFVDVWPNYRMDAMVPDMQAFHRAVPAPACFYWGQELDAVDRFAAQGGGAEAFDAAGFEAFREAVGLPLVGREQPAYPDLCRRAAANPAIGAKRRPIA